MKIFVDGTFYKASGIGRYYSNLLELIAEERSWKVITTVPKRLEEEWLREFGNYENITPLFVNYEKFNLNGFLRGGKILKELEKECRVFWFPHINLPLYVPKNTIVTVHDLCPLTPWWDRSFLSKVIFARLLKRAVKTAEIIVVPSNFTKNELLKRFPEAGNKVRVVYNFISEKFFTEPKKDEKPLVEGDYILFIGNRKKHKNVKNLVLAYSSIKDQFDCKLVIVGSRDKNRKEDEIDKLIKKLNLRDHVVQFENVSDEKLINLYKNAKLFVFPSFYEGFGLPPLEALACGCPVLVSNIPVFQEILNESIARFDPSSIEDIREKILELLKDERMRASLLQRSLDKISNFRKETVKENMRRIVKLLSKESDQM
ncbi:MAG: glycosyltransferase family 1 protein [Zestosphaera sp.]